MGRIRRHLGKVEMAAGVLLVITGLMIMTGRLQILAYWILETFPALATLG
jgi:cytochrome c-type biogenesis protein